MYRVGLSVGSDTGGAVATHMVGGMHSAMTFCDVRTRAVSSAAYSANVALLVLVSLVLVSLVSLVLLP